MRELKVQFANALLVVLTIAAAVSAFVNFQQNFHPEKRYRLPEDGVTWVDRKLPDGRNSVQALIVEAIRDPPNGPESSRGSAPQDPGAPGRTSSGRYRDATYVKPYLNAKYTLKRRGIEFNATVIVGERTPDYNLYYQYLIGLAYLGIGLFVYFRRGNAPKSLHFLLLCLRQFRVFDFPLHGQAEQLR